MINRQLVHFDTAGNRVIINPGEMTNTGGDNWDITPSGYVPWTSATSADVPNTVALRDADGGFSVGNLQIDTTPPVIQTDGVGKLVWNDTDGTVQFLLKGGDVTMNVGEREVTRVRNADVVPMTPGQVVYLFGSTGSHKEVKLANASAEATSSGTIGVVAEPIAVNQEGYIITTGVLRDINTLALTQGAPVWLSTVTGQMTSTRPNAPNHGVVVGFCVRQHATVGAVYVKVDNGWELDELHNVYISGVANGDLLVYNGANTRWQNLPVASQPWVLKAGDTMTNTLIIDHPTGTAGLICKAFATNGVGAITIAGKGNGTEFANFYLQDQNGYPSGNLWSFSMRNDKSFLFFSYGGGSFVNVMSLQQNGGIRIGPSFVGGAAVAANVLAVAHKLGAGVSAPTATVHVKAGTATAGTAPLKFTSGPLMTTAEAGAVEFLTDKAYLTITTGAARKELTLNDTALTAGQAPTVNTNGRLTNSNKFNIYATGTTNGAAGSAVNLTLASMPTAGEVRFFRITVKAKSAAAMPDLFGRTLDAYWGNAAGVLNQVGASSLGPAMTMGNLAAATIATTAAGTTLRVTCTDVTGCGAVVTWEVFGEYY